MHRDDTSKYLLYIEPRKEDKLKNPIEDVTLKSDKRCITLFKFI